MIQIRLLSITTLIAAVCLTLCLTTAAQQPSTADTNYDVTLQLVIGSNEPGLKKDLPADLGPLSKQIRSSFDFAGYRVASTFLGRIASNGNFDYNSVASIEGKDLSSSVPTFLDWSLRDLHAVAASRSLQASSFRFGARVPIFVGDAGKGQQAVNYENLGVGLNRVGLNENTPTLVGTLHLPGTTGTIFLVMTIRPTQN
jgi:hypothetical protein